MPLGKHTRNPSGRIRKERSDSLAKNLREDYPEFKKVHGNKKLGTLEKEFGVDSLSQVREKLKNS